MPSNSDLIVVSFLRDLIGEEDDKASQGPPPRRLHFNSFTSSESAEITAATGFGVKATNQQKIKEDSAVRLNPLELRLKK